MIARTVDPADLISVRHMSGLSYNVLRADLEARRAYLNTYSRNGALKVSRGCTVPVSIESIAP